MEWSYFLVWLDAAPLSSVSGRCQLSLAVVLPWEEEDGTFLKSEIEKKEPFSTYSAYLPMLAVPV